MPIYFSGVPVILPFSSITEISGKLCLWPISKSVASCAGVTLRAPLPVVISTALSEIIAMSRFISGIFAVNPTSLLKRLSLGLTATATSANIVSGRVVATVNLP